MEYNTKMNAFSGVFAIDSWHLTGGHFPEVTLFGTDTTLEELLDILESKLKAYKISTSGVSITKEYLKEEFNKEVEKQADRMYKVRKVYCRTNNLPMLHYKPIVSYASIRISFDSPREGSIIIRGHELV